MRNQGQSRGQDQIRHKGYYEVEFERNELGNRLNSSQMVHQEASCPMGSSSSKGWTGAGDEGGDDEWMIGGKLEEW